ncbi:MAG: HAMP domain-containing sensor histidine kinase [Candidatus Pelethousia sp.]|nr:HAMP domain-containing sensor histidine kinase [Candidatus Pelethousia sp.]
MKKAYYGFMYKTLAVLLCVALGMGLAYCLLGLAFAHTDYAIGNPELVDIPYLFSQEQDVVLIAAAAIGLCLLGCLAFLLHASGRRPDEEGFYPGWQEKIPLDVYLAAVAVCVALVIAFISQIGYSLSFKLFDFMFVALPATAILSLLALALLTTLAVRLKLGGWWRNTACYWALRLVWRVWKWAWRLCKRLFKGLWKGIYELAAALPTIWPVALGTGVLLLAVSILTTNIPYSGFSFLLWFALCVAIFLGCCYGALQFGALRKAAERLAAGDLEAKADTKRLLPIFRRHAESINSIGLGMATAVEERLKSERFKTELITNVSHDLKTPLTSIINYVDLLGKEQLNNEKAAEYIEVLSRQAQRLKKLTEDLIEASKASTGNMAVERNRTEVAELLSQCSAEYTERMQSAGLAMVCDAQKGLYALADGRLLWRVFDNLLGNACKYAQSGTRVYLTACEQDGKAHIEIKNISREVLNISTDELMERFVRGDSSRAAEGSGLGLSIAQSLTQLNGGSLTLHVDGDLFKAMLDLELA